MVRKNLEDELALDSGQFRQAIRACTFECGLHEMTKLLTANSGNLMSMMDRGPDRAMHSMMHN